MSSYSSNPKYCSCFEGDVPECVENLYLQTDEILQDLTIEIVDKFRNVYQQDVVTDNVGTLIIDFTLFPAGLFSKYGGDFYLIAYPKGSNNKHPITFPTDIGGFACITLRFVGTYNTNNPYPTDYFLEGVHYFCCCGDIVPIHNCT